MQIIRPFQSQEAWFGDSFRGQDAIQSGILLGQRKVDDKSNEILLTLFGCDSHSIALTIEPHPKSLITRTQLY